MAFRIEFFPVVVFDPVEVPEGDEVEVVVGVEREAAGPVVQRGGERLVGNRLPGSPSALYSSIFELE